LKRRDSILFNTCTNALKNSHPDKAKVCATELAEVRKLIKFLYNVELAIERVVLRLETVRELSDIVIDLKPALKMLGGISRNLFNLMPDISSEISNINDTIGETLYSTKLTADESIIPVNQTTQGGTEVLREVSSFLEQKVADKLPEPPLIIESPIDSELSEQIPVKQLVALAASCSQTISEQSIDKDNFSSLAQSSYKAGYDDIPEITLKLEVPSLEEGLLEYIRKNRGEINLMKCSLELKASYSEIEEAFQKLKTTRKIVIKHKKGEFV